jgi:hypothetical protein
MVMFVPFNVMKHITDANACIDAHTFTLWAPRDTKLAKLEIYKIL